MNSFKIIYIFKILLLIMIKIIMLFLLSLSFFYNIIWVKFCFGFLIFSENFNRSFCETLVEFSLQTL